MNLTIRMNHTPFCLDFYVLIIKSCTYFVVLWVRLGVLLMLAKHSTARLHLRPTLKCFVQLGSQQLSLRSCRRLLLTKLLNKTTQEQRRHFGILGSGAPCTQVQ